MRISGKHLDIERAGQLVNRWSGVLLLVLTLMGLSCATTPTSSQAEPERHSPFGPAREESVVPEVEVSLDEVQAILEESGLEMRRIGRSDGATPTLLVVQGEPKVLVSVNDVRHDVEMAVLYSLRENVGNRIYEQINEVNRKLPCQVSVTHDGNLLLESYLPYDDGLHANLLSHAVRKFQTYSRICAVHLKDLIK